MRLKYIGTSLDGIVKPRTTHEDWVHWLNRMQTQLLTMHLSSKRKIEVRYDTN